MSVTDREAGPFGQSEASLAPSWTPGRSLVPYGQGRIRGLDAAELGAHGAAMDRLVALGLPVVPGLTVPAGTATSLCEADTAEAAVELVEQLSGRRIGDAARPLLLRLSASAPTCSAHRVPVARMAAAHSALRERRDDSGSTR
ncbi:hypothetical protein [Streptomyces sp. NPDC050121]|uniref:hypothetical protein n=1 Tax=Streptomyces sp. NPDC050121 TaxID=3365601 RepID=UPI0037ABC8F1